MSNMQGEYDQRKYEYKTETKAENNDKEEKNAVFKRVTIHSSGAIIVI